MKVVGALLILFGALWGHLQHRREIMLPLRLARALASDLAVLRCEICVSRRPVPVILERDLSRGMGAEYLWHPLSRLLREDGERMNMQNCWEAALAALPAPLMLCLLPLGPLLSNGGKSLEQAVDEVREELIRICRSEEERQAAQMKLSAALSISGACLAVLILL